jgi:hypothetical protein
MKKYFSIALILTSFFCCNQTAGSRQSSSTPKAQASVDAKKNSGKAWVFDVGQIVDREAGIVAAKLLIPVGWKIQGG